jgi:hypothetical protein
MNNIHANIHMNVSSNLASNQQLNAAVNHMGEIFAADIAIHYIQDWFTCAVASRYLSSKVIPSCPPSSSTPHPRNKPKHFLNITTTPLQVEKPLSTPSMPTRTPTRTHSSNTLTISPTPTRITSSRTGVTARQPLALFSNDSRTTFRISADALDIISMLEMDLDVCMCILEDIYMNTPRRDWVNTLAEKLQLTLGMAKALAYSLDKF